MTGSTLVTSKYHVLHMHARACACEHTHTRTHTYTHMWLKQHLAQVCISNADNVVFLFLTPETLQLQPSSEIQSPHHLMLHPHLHPFRPP